MTDLLDIESYNYHLPPELIAQYPLEERSRSRLMRVDRATGAIVHGAFADILNLLAPGEVLVVNSSKVIPARLFGQKQNGTRIEVLLLHRLEGSRWKCMVHPGKRLKTAQWLDFSLGLRGWISLADDDGLREIEFAEPETYWQKIERIGHVPLPPYIRRPDENLDRQAYQTVYANDPGSVAAPTAGLHFSAELLAALKRKGVQIVEVILHVGMGTFLPVKSQRIDEHKMHSEFCTVPAATAIAVNDAKAEGRRVIAVGSTSVRTLESFWQEGQLKSGSHWTDIFIFPGRKIQSVDALVTNFHLPRSSLLMMISAFAGYSLIRRAYQAAVEEKYRFFSYGDAMYIS
ncbi:MAG: tRNA preQ1(34) S-adenosylmethionine ribosyltransferase-isomerase QueA [Candidatus Cloacimonetes bacterium]|nr:tRNA preQ1(34) S-adenosylmethionine ribosyltransferase-isomerase QueA [Candidatus Cloacimonadota bacterium]